MSDRRLQDLMTFYSILSSRNKNWGRANARRLPRPHAMAARDVYLVWRGQWELRTTITNFNSGSTADTAYLAAPGGSRRRG